MYYGLNSYLLWNIYLAESHTTVLNYKDYDMPHRRNDIFYKLSVNDLFNYVLIVIHIISSFVMIDRSDKVHVVLL